MLIVATQCKPRPVGAVATFVWGACFLVFGALAAGGAPLDASEREQFTLKDGRVLVGSYDEATQTLAIESPRASMHVDVRDIAKREEAPPVPASTSKPEGPMVSEGLDGLVAASDQRSSAIRKRAEPLIAQYNDLMAQADKADDDFAWAWILTANLEAAAAPALPSDPLQSQMQRKAALDRLNNQLASLRNSRTAYTTPRTHEVIDRATGKRTVVTVTGHQAEAALAEERASLTAAARRFLHSDRDTLALYTATR